MIPPAQALYPIDRFRGAFLGLALGDAVGTTVEFQATRHLPTSRPRHVGQRGSERPTGVAEGSRIDGARLRDGDVSVNWNDPPLGKPATDYSFRSPTALTNVTTGVTGATYRAREASATLSRSVGTYGRKNGAEGCADASVRYFIAQPRNNPNSPGGEITQFALPGQGTAADYGVDGGMTWVQKTLGAASDRL